MRIRTIKPEFWSHPVMSRQSDATRLLAIGLLNLADDDGYFFADPKMVRNHLRPLDDDSRITHGSLTELSQIGYIKTIQHKTHGPIGKIVAFKSHQVINRPNASKIKHLFDSLNDHGKITDPSLPEGKGTGNEGTREVPPNPQGGMEEGEFKLEITEPPKPKSILPSGWEKMSKTKQKQTRVNINSQTMNRIGKMLGRRDGTLWTVAEAVALKTVNPQPEEIELMETYYLAEIEREDDIRRRDLITLLNNWNGELDRARIFSNQ